MAIPLSPEISLSPSSYSSAGTAITASVSLLNRPAYGGKPAITGLTTITPKIICSRQPSGAIPFHVMVSSSETSCNAGHPYTDLHYSWDFGDSAGTETFVDQFNGQTVNLNTSQTGPEAAYIYRTPGTYTITLTATGKDQNGDNVTATTTAIQTVGLYYYFLANATGGTFTLTFNGQTTTSLAFDADSWVVEAALVALSNLDATTVFCPKVMNCVQFIGSLAGQSYTFTADFAGLTGTDGTPLLISRAEDTSGEHASVTVTDLSGFTAQYFDSTYAGANGASDGTETRPYTTWSEVTTFIRDGSSRVAYLKRGSVFPMSANMNPATIRTNIRLLPYGTGANPKVTSTIYQITPVLLNGNVDCTDYVFSHIDFQTDGGSGVGAFFFTFPSTNGGISNPYSALSNFVIDSCNWISTYAPNYNEGHFANLNGNAVNKGKGFSGWAVWGGVFDAGNVGKSTFLTSINQWASMVECTIRNGEGNLDLDGHIYPNFYMHSLLRYIKFEAGVRNYCVNTNAMGSKEASQYMVVDGCDMTGTMNGIDFSNTQNDYTLSGFYDLVVLSGNRIHSGRQGTQEYGLLCNNLYRITIRDNLWWNNDDSHINSADTTKPTTYSIYRNLFAGSVGGNIAIRANQVAYFHDNVIQNARTILGCISFLSGATSVEQWDCDGNIYYAPNMTQPFWDATGAAWVSFATWQGYGNDANGSVQDPNFSDPANGLMFSDVAVTMNWPAGFTSLEYSVNGTDWFAYTNAASQIVAAALGVRATVFFRATTDSGGSVSINGTSTSANAWVSAESFAEMLISSLMDRYLPLSVAGGFLVFKWSEA